MHLTRILGFAALAVLLVASALRLSAGDTATEKRDKINDRTEIHSSWIYDDFPAAVARAKRENKPILAVFR
jgi:hypothetical protein